MGPVIKTAPQIAKVLFWKSDLMPSNFRKLVLYMRIFAQS